MVDVTDTTVVSAYYVTTVVYTPQIHYRHDRRACKLRTRRRRRSEMTSAGECLYARILYSKIKYKK